MTRNLSSIAVVAAFVLPGAVLAQSKSDAQSYPVRPVRIIVPNTAGSAMDVVTRMLSQRFSEMWGQQVVVDKRAGASGIIGTELTKFMTEESARFAKIIKAAGVTAQ